MPLDLYHHQKELLEKAPLKWLLAWSTGVGKSLAAIKLAETNGISNVLVICPKSLKDQWIEEVAKHSIEKRLWLVLTKEEFKKKHKELQPYKKIIIDELHFLGNYKSGLSKAMLWYVDKHNPKQIYGLTATPYLSTVWNIYTYCLIFGRSTKDEWYQWKRMYFDDVYMGRRTVPVQKKYIGKEKIEDHVARMVNKLGNTIKMEDCIDVPDQVFKTEYFDLTKEQLKAIEELKDAEHIVYWTKVHQICGGTLKSDGYTEDLFLKSEKFERLLELCTISHKKAVVVCRYNNEIEYLRKELSKHSEVIVINGAVTDKHEKIKLADSLDKCIILVNAACSEGYELPSFPVMIFYSYDFSLKNYIQMIGRIQRINAIKKNIYISLVVKNTVDEDVYKCLLKKKSFDIAIYNK